MRAGVKSGSAKVGTYTITMQGVDIYDPVTNTIDASRADKVAVWFIDTACAKSRHWIPAPRDRGTRHLHRIILRCPTPLAHPAKSPGYAELCLNRSCWG